MKIRYWRKEENRVLFYTGVVTYVQAFLNTSEMKGGIFRVSDVLNYAGNKLEKKIKAFKTE